MKAIIKVGENTLSIILPDEKIATIKRDDESLVAIEILLKTMGYNISYENMI